jgi:hypothetical protein
LLGCYFGFVRQIHGLQHREGARQAGCTRVCGRYRGNRVRRPRLAAGGARHMGACGCTLAFLPPWSASRCSSCHLVSIAHVCTVFTGFTRPMVCHDRDAWFRSAAMTWLLRYLCRYFWSLSDMWRPSVHNCSPRCGRQVPSEDVRGLPAHEILLRKSSWP